MKAILAMLLLGAISAVPACEEHQHAASAAAAVSGESLFQLAVPLTDQTNQPFKLGQAGKKATLITMFYGDCNISCPIVLENVKRTITQLPAAQRGAVQAVLVSLNPGVDTAKSLAALAKVHEMDERVYRLVVSDNDAHTRQLAATLGVKYRRGANGEINHNTRFVVLDQQGQVVKASVTLSVEPDPALLAALQNRLTN
ncbi:SCO family protein [Chitinibacter bivalviorum]|uniref:SCO family protein n=1 Tax=Chitinibacter bivalviorum TaxID=2739434 RepID=A0A7H9BJ41_9NEIS|nr:SCO family protein [Chitinibacter bivalviorum]QLG88011.1 SCO family protein [Chitinibacter bivalviorum]